MMLTRRDVLAGAFAASAMMRTRGASAEPSQPRTPVNFEVPAGACDCHTHIHPDPARFPFFAGRSYTPEPASAEQMAALHKALGIQRVVIVTPSVYGTDNSATLHGMKARGADARGVAVIDARTSENDLEAMDRAGVCGMRLNLLTAGISDPEVGRQRLRDSIPRAAKRGWHVQINTSPAMVAAVRDLVASSPVPIVFDHFAGARPQLGLDQPGYPELLDLVRSGKAYIKISGVYRSSKHAPEYADMAPFAKALIAANSDRVLWGTDWPHPDPAPPPGGKAIDVSPLLQIDDGVLLNLLPVWAPDAALRRRILVENPARLYRF
jgi:predicted TIM-barrel fold metal-dependent hydrolase